MQTIKMKRLRQQCSSEKRKILIGYLRIFQLELPIVVFVVFSLEDCYMYIGRRTSYLHIN